MDDRVFEVVVLVVRIILIVFGGDQ